MEQPRRLTARALGAALLAAIALAGFWESRSPISEAARTQRPFLFYLALRVAPKQNPPDLFLGVYNPRQPELDLVYLPGNARKDISGIPALENVDPPLFRGSCAAENFPPLEALHWIESPIRHLFVGPLVSRALKPKEIPRRALLALRLAQIPSKNVVAAWLPDARDARNDFFGRLLSGRAAAQRPGPITVEILNASGVTGLASDATKILRSRGADVMSSGNAQDESARTVIYDRTGRFKNARAVARMLACSSAAVIAWPDPSRLVDVSVIIAQDCAQALKGRTSWN